MPRLLPFRALSKALRFWRPSPVNLPATVTACAWDYTPKPPFIIVDFDTEPEQLRAMVKATTVDAACRHFAGKLRQPLTMVHAVIDARAMIVLAVSHENIYSGCAQMWSALARYHEPVDCAILETWAKESMA